MAISDEFNIVETFSFSMDIGEKIIIRVPVNENNSASGSFPMTESVNFRGSDLTLTNGFAMKDTAVGVFSTVTSEPCLHIEYTHRQPSDNTIWFFGIDGRIAQYNIVVMPIHDHSSIYQGGPAHGTYFSEASQQT